VGSEVGVGYHRTDTETEYDGCEDLDQFWAEKGAPWDGQGLQWAFHGGLYHLSAYGAPFDLFSASPVFELD
jgi:hypothetical protein